MDSVRLSDLDASPWYHRGGMGPGGRKHFGMLGARRGKYDTSIAQASGVDNRHMDTWRSVAISIKGKLTCIFFQELTTGPKPSASDKVQRLIGRIGEGLRDYI